MTNVCVRTYDWGDYLIQTEVQFIANHSHDRAQISELIGHTVYRYGYQKVDHTEKLENGWVFPLGNTLSIVRNTVDNTNEWNLDVDFFPTPLAPSAPSTSTRLFYKKHKYKKQRAILPKIIRNI